MFFFFLVPYYFVCCKSWCSLLPDKLIKIPLELRLCLKGLLILFYVKDREKDGSGNVSHEQSVSLGR